MRFRFTQDKASPAFKGKVLLDGYDASSAIHGFRVSANVRDLTTVTLDAVVLDGVELDMDALILIPAPTVALLTEFGWTPPDGAEVSGGAMRLSRITKEPDLMDMVEGEPDHGTIVLTERICICATDPDAPESCPVHGRVHRRP